MTHDERDSRPEEGANPPATTEGTSRPRARRTRKSELPNASTGSVTLPPAPPVPSLADLGPAQQPPAEPAELVAPRPAARRSKPPASESGARDRTSEAPRKRRPSGRRPSSAGDIPAPSLDDASTDSITPPSTTPSVAPVASVTAEAAREPAPVPARRSTRPARVEAPLADEPSLASSDDLEGRDLDALDAELDLDGPAHDASESDASENDVEDDAELAAAHLEDEPEPEPLSPEEARRERRDRRRRERDGRASDSRETRVEPAEDDRRFAAGPRPAIYRRAFPADHVDDDAVKVLKRLHRNGFLGYLVGGGVRDLILGRRPKDFDIATNARPHDIKVLFRNCRVIGRRFRLAHILFGGGKIIETATFRRDPTSSELEAELDASDEPLTPRAKSREDDADLLIRHDNVFGEPHEDALRRDFRMNGLFYDIETEEVIDYVGGMRDLESRVIDTIGLPDVRFREDPVRILRALKFSARLDMGIAPECYDAMVAQREELRKAAKARLFEEIMRLLRGGAAHRSIWLAWEMGVLAVLVPQVSTMLDDDAPRTRELWARLDAIDAIVAEGRVPSDTVLLAALFEGAIEEAVEGARDPLASYEDLLSGVNDILAIPRRLKERMRVVIGCQRRLRSGKLGTLPQREFFGDALQLYEIECLARGERPAAFLYGERGSERPSERASERDERGSFDPGRPFDGGGEGAGRRRRRRRR